MKKVEKTLEMEGVNFLKEINERRTRDKNILIFKLKDSENAVNIDLNNIKSLEVQKKYY